MLNTSFKTRLIRPAFLGIGVILASGGCGPKAPAPAKAAASPVVGSDESFRAHQPTPAPTPALNAPVPTTLALDNELPLLAVQQAELPLVYFSLVLRAGSARDPKKLPGLAGFTAEMLKAGTKDLDARQFAESVETLGSSLHISTSDDATTIEFTALSQHFPAILKLAADAFLNPAFPGAEVERTRKKRMGALAQAESDPRSTARRVFRKAVYGDHPYGHTALGTEETLSKIRTKDVRKFWKSELLVADATAIVVGDITPDEAKVLLNASFGKWSRKGIKNSDPAEPKEIPPGLFLVDKADAPQSQLRIGHLGISRSHPDYFPVVICNAILGGLFNSRINLNLREENGYTYGARSAFAFKRQRGPFVVATGVRTDVTAPAITEVLKEIDVIRRDDVSEQELKNAKAQYSLSLPGYFQSVDGIGGMLSNIFLYDLPLDYYQQLPDRISSVTIADVKRVATEHLDPTKLSIVVVGDKKAVESPLKTLGKGEPAMLNPAGEAIQ